MKNHCNCNLCLHVKFECCEESKNEVSFEVITDDDLFADEDEELNKEEQIFILSRFHPMKRYLLDLILSLFTFKREKEFLMLRSLIPEVMLYCLVQVISKEIT